VRFIPVDLGQADRPIGKTHAPNAFELAPSATAELVSQLPSLADGQVDSPTATQYFLRNRLSASPVLPAWMPQRLRSAVLFKWFLQSRVQGFLQRGF
jgi:hypothetical protein